MQFFLSHDLQLCSSLPLEGQCNATIHNSGNFSVKGRKHCFFFFNFYGGDVGVPVYRVPGIAAGKPDQTSDRSY